MFGINQTELIIFLVVVLLIFGPKNLPRLAQSIGKSVRELKNGLSGVTEDLKESVNKPAPVHPVPNAPEVQPVARHADASESEKTKDQDETPRA